MKKIKILASIMVLICNISCSELDLAPISSMATNSMWNTRDDAIAAKNGMYYLFRNAFADTYQYYGELRTGLYKFGRSFYEQWVPLFDNQLIPSSTGTDWTNFYTLINHCNLILKYVPEIEMLQTDKDKILAEAHFVRAFIYFWLARIWGEVPVITVPFESDNQENLYPVRNPVSTVWQQIKNDLAEAESLYPATEQIQESYYVNIAAIQMLKTDVYLWLYKVENESEALVKAEEGVNAVLGNSSYALEPVFRNIFRKESNNENIFTISRDFIEEGGGNPNGWFTAMIWRDGDVPAELHNNPIPIGSGGNVFRFTDIAWDLVYEDPNDQRSKETFDSLHHLSLEYEWIVKYSGEYIGQLQLNQNQHVYRFAEAFLFKAEVENEKNNTLSAINYLNEIAERAYGVTDYYSSTLSGSEVNDIILKERCKELFFEGKHWWDLIRFDKLFEKVPTLIGRENELNVMLWPVNYNTINKNNKITQTPGYD